METLHQNYISRNVFIEKLYFPIQKSGKKVLSGLCC